MIEILVLFWFVIYSLSRTSEKQSYKERIITPIPKPFMFNYREPFIPRKRKPLPIPIPGPGKIVKY